VRKLFLDSDGSIDDWLGVVVRWPSGVIYGQQCGGILTLQRTIEGYYVPVGGVRVGGERDPNIPRFDWRDLRRFFLDRIGIESALGGPAEWRDSLVLAELRTIVGTIPWWIEGESIDHTRRLSLAVDDTRESQIVEAWVPVRLHDDGTGVLVWPNSD